MISAISSGFRFPSKRVTMDRTLFLRKKSLIRFRPMLYSQGLNFSGSFNLPILLKAFMKISWANSSASTLEEVR